MISLDELVKDGLLSKTDLPEEIPITTADFSKVRKPLCCPEIDNSICSLCLLTVSALPLQDPGPCICAAPCSPSALTYTDALSILDMKGMFLPAFCVVRRYLLCISQAALI